MSFERKLLVGDATTPEGWDVCGAQPDSRYVSGPARCTGVPDAAYHLVLAADFPGLDRRTQVMQALREWLRVLIPGGRLLIVIPDAARIMPQFSTCTTPGQQMPVLKLLAGCLWTPEILALWLGAAGFASVGKLEQVPGIKPKYVLKNESVTLYVTAVRPQAD